LTTKVVPSTQIVHNSIVVCRGLKQTHKHIQFTFQSSIVVYS
jgi:hypothetical protein